MVRTSLTETQAEPVPVNLRNDRKELRSFWEQRYGRSLSDFDEQEIASNLSQVFGLLADWDRKARASGNSVDDEDSADV